MMRSAFARRLWLTEIEVGRYRATAAAATTIRAMHWKVPGDELPACLG